MSPEALKQWRKDQRDRLVETRLALSPEALHEFRLRIDTHLERAFPGFANGTLAICWPFKNEYDPRFLAHRLRERGARTALPVVVAPRQPLVFRPWAPGDELAKGAYDIPYPASGEPVVPDYALVPMNAFDAGGYRLGYGGGFYDRMLGSLEPRPFTVGLGFGVGYVSDFSPEAHDVPLDAILTDFGEAWPVADIARPER